MCKISPHHYNDNLDNFSILFMTSEFIIIVKVVNTRKTRLKIYHIYFHSNCIVQFPDLTKDNELRTRTQVM